MKEQPKKKSIVVRREQSMNISNYRRLLFVSLPVFALVYISATSSAELLRERTPAPELERLATRTIGTWETTAKCWFSPDAPMFEGKSVESIYWSKSRQFIISDKRGLTPSGWVSQLQVTTWDPLEKHFQIVEFTPGGRSFEMIMRLKGDSAEVTGTGNDGARTMKIWLTVEFISPTKSHFRSECSIDNGPKWLFSEGVSKKVK